MNKLYCVICGSNDNPQKRWIASKPMSYSEASILCEKLSRKSPTLFHDVIEYKEK